MKLFTKIYTSLFLSKGVNASVVCERDRQTEMEGDEGRLLYWPETSFLDHTTLCYLQGPFLLLLSLGLLIQRLAVGRCHSRAPSHSLALSMTDRISLATSGDWLKTVSRVYLHTSFHNTNYFLSTMWLLLCIYSDASCAEKSLINGSVKGQYVIILIVYKIPCVSLFLPTHVCMLTDLIFLI